MGMGELIVIAIIALLVLGPEKLPEAAKAIGKGIRELRRHTRDLQETVEQDAELGATVRELKSALRGDDEPPPVRPAPATSSRAIAPASSAASPPATAAGASTPPGAAPETEPKTGDPHG